MQPRIPERIANGAKNAGLMLAGVLAGLLLVEGLARLAFRWLPYDVKVVTASVRQVPWSKKTLLQPAFVMDPVLQRRILPGLVNRTMYTHDNIPFSVSTETLGFENIGFRTRPLAGPPYAVVVGDSFSFCFTQFADCWVSQLEARAGVSIADLGIPATGSLSHAQVLEKYGLPLGPKLVLWEFYANDFNDDYSLLHYAEAPPDTTPKTWQASLGEYSFLSQLGFQILSRQPALSEVYRHRYHYQAGGLDLRFGQPVTFMMFDLKSNKANTEGMAAGLQAILQSREKAKAAGASLVVIIFPSKEEAYFDLLAPSMTAEEKEYLQGPRLALLELCRTQALLCLDLTGELQKRAAHEPQMYYDLDPHFNAAGNQAAAEVVFDYLKEQGLLP